ncbi:MAG: filamentous hemagglutinin N-terminal domain-containing protein [Rhodocyclaceae bacterium]|nr:filamentous hemagglutinin N-terminal domain-containing protein [Rhodocyclaceae bacterium]
MNSIYRSIWNDKTGTFVAVSENATSAGKKSSPGATAVVGAVAGNTRFALKALAVSLMMAFGANVFALPVDGVVTAGGASFSSTANSTTITQSSQNVAINWQSFSIGAGEAVQFIQPNSSSVALNRVLGADPSNIFGSLSANGKVFLVNPNGILFGHGSQVNVGGLVASTLNMTDSDFMAGNYNFSGTGGTVLNQGTINADGGYVALLGANVGNDGTIVARLGTVTLAAGNAITLDVAGDGLLNVTVNQGAVNALIQNGGLIQADGGRVLLTAQAAGDLLQTVVNNTGVIQAQTIENRNGTIMLMGDMQSGTVNVGGTLDASAPNGGNGGFIETSAAFVKIANDVKVTTAAPLGLTGTWLIDPLDFYISASGGNISGATLSAQLVTNNVTISLKFRSAVVTMNTPTA